MGKKVVRNLLWSLKFALLTVNSYIKVYDYTNIWCFLHFSSKLFSLGIFSFHYMLSSANLVLLTNQQIDNR